MGHRQAKVFLDKDEQTRLLERRGVLCDGDTPRVLLREGYYAVVNGYKGPFLDKGATEAAGDDRYLEGTSFSDLYALFRFDRELRALTFRHLMVVEGTLRSVLSYSFCERHPTTEAYLDGNCYTTARRYLRGEDRFAGDLRWMISTLEQRAHEQGSGDPHDVGRGDVRVMHYQRNYDGVPLWVLMGDLTFGNLKYFYALMRREEQVAACDRLAAISGCASRGHPLTPRGMAHDLETLVDVRNVCAHGERLYNAGFGEEDRDHYPDFLRRVSRYLTPNDFGSLRDGIAKAVDAFASEHPVLGPILEEAGLRGRGTI